MLIFLCLPIFALEGAVSQSSRRANAKAAGSAMGNASGRRIMCLAVAKIRKSRKVANGFGEIASI
jgi:hypothetical protein